MKFNVSALVAFICVQSTTARLDIRSTETVLLAGLVTEALPAETVASPLLKAQTGMFTMQNTSRHASDLCAMCTNGLRAKFFIINPPNIKFLIVLYSGSYHL